MGRFKFLTTFKAALLCVVAVPALAQASPVELSGSVKVVTTQTAADGSTTRVYSDPDRVIPGDHLLFLTDYRNSGSEAVANFVITNPLPAAVKLSEDADPSLTVSVDGGASWGPLSQLTVALDDGSTRPAVHGDVTHIRWTLAEVAPGVSGTVEYPATIR